VPNVNIYASSCRYKWNSWNRHTDRSATLPVWQCKHSGVPIKGRIERKGRGARGEKWMATLGRKEEKFEHLDGERCQVKKGWEALWTAGICMASPLLSLTIKANWNLKGLLLPCVTHRHCHHRYRHCCCCCVVAAFNLCTLRLYIAAGLEIIECAFVWWQCDLMSLPHKHKLYPPPLSLSLSLSLFLSLFVSLKRNGNNWNSQVRKDVWCP